MANSRDSPRTLCRKTKDTLFLFSDLVLLLLLLRFIPQGLRDSRKYSYLFPLLVKNQPRFPHKICTLCFIVIISNNSYFLAHCFYSVAICSCFNTTGFSQLSLMLWIFFFSKFSQFCPVSCWAFDLFSHICSLSSSSDIFHITCFLCLLMVMRDDLISRCSQLMQVLMEFCLLSEHQIGRHLRKVIRNGTGQLASPYS